MASGLQAKLSKVKGVGRRSQFAAELLTGSDLRANARRSVPVPDVSVEHRPVDPLTGVTARRGQAPFTGPGGPAKRASPQRRIRSRLSCPGVAAIPAMSCRESLRLQDEALLGTGSDLRANARRSVPVPDVFAEPRFVASNSALRERATRNPSVPAARSSAAEHQPSGPTPSFVTVVVPGRDSIHAATSAPPPSSASFSGL